MPLGTNNEINDTPDTNAPPESPVAVKLPYLSQAELRELARILHEMLRRDLALERDRLGR